MSCRNRLERAETLRAADARLAAGQTQRQVAAELGMARGTLQDWRAGSAEAGPGALAAFVATPEGVRWLHRMVLAAQFTITLRGGAGVRMVCEFLELSGLSAFVGSSYGSQQALNAALEVAVVAVATEQRTALAEGMAPRDVTACEDETFHPRICLVALEPGYVTKRKNRTPSRNALRLPYVGFTQSHLSLQRRDQRTRDAPPGRVTGQNQVG